MPIELVCYLLLTLISPGIFFRGVASLQQQRLYQIPYKKEERFFRKGPGM